MAGLRWIVIPARNEAARLGATIRTYLAALSPSDHIVVVVNGSTDDTAGVAASIATEDGRLEVVDEPLPIGKGGAITKGFGHVLSKCANDDVVCLTDADGAVPPAELVRVCDAVEPGILVVGSRWLNPKLQSPRQRLLRRLASRVFNCLVRLILHLDLCDTQCAAKAVHASSLRPIASRVNTSGFGFDLDFLLAAPLGRVAVREIPIRWGDRDGSTVRLTRAVPDMIQELVRLKGKYTRLAAQAGTTLSEWSAAVCQSGDAILPPARRCEAARRVLSKRQVVLLALIITLLIGLVYTFPLFTAIAVNAVVIAIYGLANLFKLILVHRSLEDPPVINVEPHRDAAGDWQLPVFTILVPLYKEAAVVAQLVEGITRLDYPQARLDVKLLLEEDDVETQQALEKLHLPRCFEGLLIPNAGPPGKPRACNEGLRRARGEYLVIYDAEDRPEPDQLRKVVAAFDEAPSDVACVQAKLSYFNRDQNLLTRWFTAEYSMWFDLLLPGLRSLDVPIPLGGTSNFFITDRLRELGGWDAYNVTEDADLGLRLYEYGWRTAILDSTTYEEASSRIYNWIRQRSRWIKGYLHTYLIHMRHPVRTYRAIGGRAFIAFNLFFAGAVAVPIVNPIYWAMTILWYVAHPPIITALFPPPVLLIGTLALFLGNLAFTMTHVWGAVARGHYSDVKWTLLSPIYWLLISVAAWRGVLQILHKPHYWEKTQHGFFLISDGTRAGRNGGDEIDTAVEA